MAETVIHMMIGRKVRAKVMISKKVEEQGKSLCLGPCTRRVVRRKSALSAIQFSNDGGACLSRGRLQLRRSLADYLYKSSRAYSFKSLVGTDSDKGL
jgi:hypothetical protein